MARVLRRRIPENPGRLPARDLNGRSGRRRLSGCAVCAPTAGEAASDSSSSPFDPFRLLGHHSSPVAGSQPKSLECNAFEQLLWQ